MRGKVFLVIGGIAAGCAVAAGALGAHALEDKLTADQMNSFDTAVRNQMYHALALISVGLLVAPQGSRLLATAGWMFTAGILLFSGGIYAWLFTGVKPFVHIVPIGGVIWILGWICFVIATCKSPRVPGGM